MSPASHGSAQPPWTCPTCPVRTPTRGETAHFVWNRRDHLTLLWSHHGKLVHRCRLIAYPSRLIGIGFRTLIPLVLYQWHLPQLLYCAEPLQTAPYDITVARGRIWLSSFESSYVESSNRNGNSLRCSEGARPADAGSRPRAQLQRDVLLAIVCAYVLVWIVSVSRCAGGRVMLCRWRVGHGQKERHFVR